MIWHHNMTNMMRITSSLPPENKCRQRGSKRRGGNSVSLHTKRVGNDGYGDGAVPQLQTLTRSAVLITSVALSALMIDCGWCHNLFVDAVDPSTAPSTRRNNKGLSPNLGSYSNNKIELIDETTETAGDMKATLTSVERDDNAHDKRDDDSKLISSQTDRKHRQKQRQTHHRQMQPNGLQLQYSTRADYSAYMHWCQKVLGIKSVVEIQEFEYLDHLQMHWDENAMEQQYDSSDDFDWLHQYSKVTSENTNPNNNIVDDRQDTNKIMELPTKMVRGLAAQNDIQVGDLVISIPLYSLLSVPTTIDHDPVLSRILGPDARKVYGWTDTTEYELTLLSLALLYHRSLGNDSPISHYIDILLETPTDSFPFLWSDHELREKAGDDREVTKLARGIRQHVHDMYDQVMGTLVRENADSFAPPDGYRLHQSADGVDNEWAYSYKKFQWAFALVISRHHYLPIHDFDEDDAATPKRPTVDNSGTHTISTVTEAVPPANQPVSSWVDEAHNEERVVDGVVVTDDDQTLSVIHTKHSFLAPLADLINFGPPCLTGRYNEGEHTFELIATCPFAKGQEVTFWYSSDCADAIIANYGFLHPLVPSCASPVDWEKESEEWREKIKMREKELWEVYRRVDLLKDELAALERKLISCGCDDGEKKQIYSMPTASSAEATKLRRDGHHHHSLRQDIGVRGRINEGDEQEITIQQAMEELG